MKQVLNAWVQSGGLFQSFWSGLPTVEIPEGHAEQMFLFRVNLWTDSGHLRDEYVLAGCERSAVLQVCCPELPSPECYERSIVERIDFRIQGWGSRSF